MRHVESLSHCSIITISGDSTLIRIRNIFQRNDSELRAIMEVLKKKPYDDYILMMYCINKDSQELR